jgi:hypothetical protein
VGWTAAVADETALIAEVEDSIRMIRATRVMVDADLAALYGVETRALTQAVRRNLDRFPDDFMFQLTDEEFADLKSQTVISSQWGGRRTRPYVFTEQGVAMLSSVLRSDRAVQVNIEIMRAFVRLRRLLASNAELERRLDELEERYDQQFRAVFDTIRELMRPPQQEALPAPKAAIGFPIRRD